MHKKRSDTSNGVYIDKKKNGSNNYRASMTINNKHISLGSYSSEHEAAMAYEYAKKLFASKTEVTDFPDNCPLSFEKFVILINLRDNKIYFSNPIYLENRFFSYYYSPEDVYKFDMDDLFYFSSHKIMKRGNHLFVADYGSQVSVYEHLGIRAFSVPGRDFLFINDDKYDLRRENIEIVNPYFGVRKQKNALEESFKTFINITGKFVVGTYDSEIKAAIAYNKAVDVVTKQGIAKKYPQNYIEGISAREYAAIYSDVEISKKLYMLS
ncbi:MAG: hypothetical protein MJ107_03640 [Lachnospiraceae bacterium]|nr:hypothetical protein [Lachnospiraceae bacterium]